MTSAREWLIAGAPGAGTSPEVLAGACERMIAEGVPVARAEAYVQTLHPIVAGRAFEWMPGSGCRAIDELHDKDASSPLRRVYATGKPHRDAPSAHLVALGMADMFVVPLSFINGEVHAALFASRERFTDAHLATIEATMMALSRIAEILALRRSATNVLAAYVGRDAGARVLAGKIRRGDVDLVEAAIWFSDMRGFSTMSNTRSPREVIERLNELFDFQVPAIEHHGGEVLKFIGDGLLAIFSPQSGGMRACCERALAASRAAQAAAEAYVANGGEPIRFGIALHVGEVAYGNIGGAGRLDFTCIGRAVNLAARLESLTGQLARDVLASEDFERSLGGDALVRVGAFDVKGFAQPIAAYAPR